MFGPNDCGPDSVHVFRSVPEMRPRSEGAHCPLLTDSERKASSPRWKASKTSQREAARRGPLHHRYYWTHRDRVIIILEPKSKQYALKNDFRLQFLDVKSWGVDYLFWLSFFETFEGCSEVVFSCQHWRRLDLEVTLDHLPWILL